MDRRLVALALLLGLAASAYPTLGAPPALPQERAFTLEAVALACDEAEGGVCLAYNGVVPGPMLDVNLGDTLVITLVNRIAETLAPLGADAALKARLANASVSWHVHGTAVAADMDGVAAHAGTNLVESVAPPGGSFTYRTRAAFAGSWHYHDHVLGLDGAEGVARGLYGGLVVRGGAEPRPDAVLDLHMLDAGANGGRGLAATLPAGGDFEVLLVGLQNAYWPVELRAPDNAVLDRADLGPGLSERFRVDDAVPGTYRLRSVGGTAGTIEVVA